MTAMVIIGVFLLALGICAAWLINEESYYCMRMHPHISQDAADACDARCRDATHATVAGPCPVCEARKGPPWRVPDRAEISTTNVIHLDTTKFTDEQWRRSMDERARRVVESRLDHL